MSVFGVLDNGVSCDTDNVQALCHVISKNLLCVLPYYITNISKEIIYNGIMSRDITHKDHVTSYKDHVTSHDVYYLLLDVLEGGWRDYREADEKHVCLWIRERS